MTTTEVRAPRPLDVETLRHHTEPSRFALAAVAAGVLVAVLAFPVVAFAGTLDVVGFLAVLLAGFVLLWLVLQLFRVRLLGQAIRVTPESLPALDAAVAEVRAALGYRDRVDVFVVAHQEQRVMLTSYFGIRVLRVQGDAVADLTDAAHRAQLVFLLATYFGALKARHLRWTPVLVAFELADVLKFVNPFINPWYRATVYTGDQIAYACCGDLDVALQAVHRLLVGKELAPQLRPEGLVEQASVVRRRTVLRLAQLLMPVPHPTNRYLNLLAFAQRRDPEQTHAYEWRLDERARATLTSTLERVPSRPASPTAAVVGLTLACAVVGASLVGAVATHVVLGSDNSTGDPSAGPTFVVTDTPTDSPTDVVTDTPTDSPTDGPSGGAAYDALAARIPADLAAACQPVDDSAVGSAAIVAAAECFPADAGLPDALYFYEYRDVDSLASAFDLEFGGLDEGPCLTEGQRCQLDYDPDAPGWMAGTTVEGTNELAWTRESDGIFTFAYSTGMSVDDLYQWWTEFDEVALGDPVT